MRRGTRRRSPHRFDALLLSPGSTTPPSWRQSDAFHTPALRRSTHGSVPSEEDREAPVWWVCSKSSAVIDAARDFDLIEIEGDAPCSLLRATSSSHTSARSPRRPSGICASSWGSTSSSSIGCSRTPLGPEDALFSDELYRTGGAVLPDLAQEALHDLEWIGPVRTYFVDIAEVAGSLLPMPDSRRLGELGRTIGVAGRGLLYVLGIRRGRRVASGH
jgi:hypothetical protein